MVGGVGPRALGTGAPLGLPHPAWAKAGLSPTSPFPASALPISVAELPKFGSRREWGGGRRVLSGGQGAAPCLAGWHFCCLEEGSKCTSPLQERRCSYLLTCTE